MQRQGRHSVQNIQQNWYNIIALTIVLQICAGCLLSTHCRHSVLPLEQAFLEAKNQEPKIQNMVADVYNNVKPGVVQLQMLNSYLSHSLQQTRQSVVEALQVAAG